MKDRFLDSGTQTRCPVCLFFFQLGGNWPTTILFSLAPDRDPSQINFVDRSSRYGNIVLRTRLGDTIVKYYMSLELGKYCN